MPKKRYPLILISMAALIGFLLTPPMALAADGAHLDGASISALWAIPFAGMLLSIALTPLIFPKFWHHHFGKVSLFWALAFLIPCAALISAEVAFYSILHAFFLEYVPFIILLFALFTVTGGIRLRGQLVGTPLINMLILALGTVIASLMGTTGAGMLLIRPLLRANAHRRYNVHTVVFFIFLVANIGGSLTPLGDPPLFLGFLKGISFFWTTRHLLSEYLFMSGSLLTIYFILDTVLYIKEGRPKPDEVGPKEKLGLDGGLNFLFLLVIIGGVLMSGSWRTTASLAIYQDISLRLPDMVRDVLLISAALASLMFTAKETRRGNDFTWEPILEVAKIFAGIFATMIPAIAILKAGADGALSGVIGLVTDQNGEPVSSMYFWMTGLLSSFLDNAPTYLVFFNTAGGDPVSLMGPYSHILAAISCGAVFMGANTYIGNAPNFMVRSIAQEQGIKMPSFFGYMLWSLVFLIPLFIAVDLLFIR